MSRYIDADAFDERVRISVGLVEEELTEDYKDGVRCTLELLKTEPTPDVVEVIRCKDCKYFYDGIYNGEYWMECDEYRIALSSDEWFCADGERREDEWNDVSIKR